MTEEWGDEPDEALRAERKAIILTQSRRTQDYLLRRPTEAGLRVQ